MLRAGMTQVVCCCAAQAAPPRQSTCIDWRPQDLHLTYEEGLLPKRHIANCESSRRHCMRVRGELNAGNNQVACIPFKRCKACRSQNCLFASWAALYCNCWTFLSFPGYGAALQIWDGNVQETLGLSHSNAS